MLQQIISLFNMRSNSAHQHSQSKNRQNNYKKRYERFQTEASPLECRELYKKPISIIAHKKNRSGTTSKYIGKQLESMTEENINLKKFINDLQQQISVQKGHLEMSKKKTTKYTKQLNREFEKQFYYSGKNPNSYMISGVKQQYEKIKQMYEQKCEEIDLIYKSLTVTNMQEMQVYIEVLEKENKYLKEQIQIFDKNKVKQAKIERKSSGKYKKGKIYKSNTSEIDKVFAEEISESVQQGSSNQSLLQQEEAMNNLVKELNEERVNLATAHRLIEKYSDRCKLYEKEVNEFQKKIKFLQKLIIEKDNNEHQARRQFHMSEKQTNNLHKKLSKIDEDYQAKIEHLEKQMKKQKQKEQKRFEDQKNIFMVTIQQKDSEITLLQKQVRYLTTLLSYWKPLDQITQDFINEGKDISKIKQFNPILIENSSRLSDDKASESIKIKIQEKSRKGSMASEQQLLLGLDMGASVLTDNEKSFKSNREREESFIRKTAEGRSQSQQNVVAVIKERAPHTCSSKYNEFSKKSRKIQLKDIQQISNLMRYRLIGLEVSIDEVKELFSYKSMEETQMDSSFHAEYISMKEVKQILLLRPFSLSETDAIKVSRYVVQDSPTQFVYVDEANQIGRNIAKSIIKAFVGSYALLDEQTMKLQWSQTIKQYGNNLRSVFSTVAPKGFIEIGKFEDILKGLGMELTDALKDWVIGQMAVGSPNLTELNYELLLKL